MSPDDVRFRQYLNARSATLDLPTGDPTSIVERAANRRRRRRSIGTGVIALAVVAAAIGVQQREDGGREVASQASASITADPLQWTSVVPLSGLGQSRSTVATDDGTLFGLSTAPGSQSSDGFPEPATLYRSTDGAEWTTVALPDQLSASQLAAAGGRVYAVGTAPGSATGTRKVVLASGDGSDTGWAQVDLPLDLAALDASHGAGASLTNLTVAANGDQIVAAAQLQALPDPTTFVPEGVVLPEDGWANWTPDGLEWIVNTGVPSVTERKDAAASEEAATTMVQAGDPAGEAVVFATFTWAELGIDDELRSLINGELHVFVSTEGGAFEEVDGPSPGSQSYGYSLESTGKGFVLIGQSWGDLGNRGLVDIWHSVDGRSWTADASGSFPGYLQSSGVIDGRAAVITQDGSSSILRVSQPDGSWSTLDLGAALGLPSDSVFGAAADIGPLGAAAVFAAPAADGSSPTAFYIVHSPDGVATAIVDGADYFDVIDWPLEVRVTADAITAVLSQPRTDGEAPSTRLLVGTPPS